MGDLIVITGPPGAGKSTVARVLADGFDSCALVPGDEFFAFVVRGFIAPWLTPANAQNTVVTRAAAAAAGHLAAVFTVVYDGVVGPWFLPTFAAATGMPQLHYAVLLPSLECCLERVATRVDHGFTDVDATRRMHTQFREAALERRHLVFDPPDDVGAVAALIRERMRDGALLHAT